MSFWKLWNIVLKLLVIICAIIAIIFLQPTKKLNSMFWETFSPIGAVFHFLIKRRARFKRNILSRKDARLCLELIVLERRHSDVSRTVKIFTVSALEQYLQAKPRCLSDQEINRIFEGTFSMISLYGCEWHRNQRTLPIVSPRCLQHCDVFVGISLEDWP